MFYERYVKLCMSRKIAPSTAATKAGFNRGTVSVWKKKYDAGLDVVPEQEIINKICDYFGCTEQWLRGIDAGKEKAPTDEGEREITMDDFTYAMHNESGDLTDDDKEWLLSMARRIAEDNRKRNQNPD